MYLLRESCKARATRHTKDLSTSFNILGDGRGMHQSRVVARATLSIIIIAYSYYLASKILLPVAGWLLSWAIETIVLLTAARMAKAWITFVVCMFTSKREVR